MTENSKNDSKESINIIESCYIMNSSSLFDENINNNIIKNNYEIIEFIRAIGNKKSNVQFIKELDNNNLICLYSNNKIFIYDTYYNIIGKIKFNDYINDIFEIIEKNNSKIINCLNNKINNISNNNSFKKNIIEIPYNLYSIPYEEYLTICDKNEIYRIFNIFLGMIQNNKEKEFIIKGKSYKRGIKITNKIFAFTSNKVISNGKDNIKFCDFLGKIEIYEINGYSFNLSINGLTLIKKDKNEILLCACKKYISGQKNGILLINLKPHYDEFLYSNFFYDTNNYEVYCFCNISIMKESNLILEEKKMINSDYFLVGGFDVKKIKE